MLSNWKRSPYAPPVLFISKRTISLTKKLYRFEPPVRFVSKRVISLQVKAVDRYVPDSMLLLFMNTLDKHVPPEVIDGVIGGLDALPPKVRSSLITAADRYVPDTASSSRKISAVIAGIYKYVPDRIIPPESVEDWSKVKTKFHIPTLLSRGQSRSRKE
ncbi:MAG TPA: hypothetical protein VMX96_04785 [Dehalococcoidia bacterium]|nr:hypothetical protein [Dehalococcoidia bacterium]